MRAGIGLMFACALGALSVGCGDDDDGGDNQGAMDASTQLDGTVPDAGADDAAMQDAAPAVDPLYLVASSITMTDESTLLLSTGKALDNASLDPTKGLQFPGGGGVAVRNGSYYVAEAETEVITRYTYENNTFVKGSSLSFLNKGIEWFSAYFEITHSDPTRAFIVSGDLLKIFEWNPVTMTHTAEYDISGLKKEGWAHEYRGSFLRASDGKLFMYWAYTNNRTDFINDFVVGVFDTKTNTLSKVLTDGSCPATAGFGGYFDEQEDLYLIADSFGLFTKFGGFKDPKDACILRIKKDADEFDPTFKLKPAQALGGREPWGLYYAGDGVAYTTAVDPARINEFASVFELIFAPVHTGFLLDTRSNTATEVKNIPTTGVGFESHRVDGKLLVPRSTGKVKIFEIEASQCTVYDIRKDATAAPLFSLPGDVTEIVRIR